MYPRKVNANGSIRLKASLVTQGYQHIEDTDYRVTYAPVAKWVSFCLFLAMAAGYHWLVHHMDVVTAFLNSLVEEDIYMQVPEDIE